MRHQRPIVALAIVLLTWFAMSAQYRYRYWFDTPANFESAVYGEETTSQLNLTVDASALPETMHMVSLQIADIDNDNWGDVRSAIFYHISQPVNEEVKSLKVFVDQNEITGQPTKAGSSTIAFDLGNMTDGLHCVNLCLETNRGVYPSGGGLVMKMTDGEAVTPRRLTYFVDGNEHLTVDIAAGSTAHVLDMAALPDGLHIVSAILEDSNGSSYPSGGSICFLKQNKDTGITGYRYWLNEEDATAQFTVVTPSESRVGLISMLDLPERPFSSKAFVCEPSGDGSLNLHPRHTVNWLFYSGDDGNGTFASCEYADVRTTVHVDNESIEELPYAYNEKTAFKGVSRNAIAWRRIEAEIGSRLTLRSDLACTVDLFDPKGKRLWTLGMNDFARDTSFVFDKGGTYYIALHDAVGDAKEALVNYSLMRNHDVVDWTPAESAKRGMVFIDVTGNGFDGISSVALSNGTTTLYTKRMHRFDNNHARLQFEFDEQASSGSYDLIMTFDDAEGGSLTKSGAIKLSEPSDGDIHISYVAPSQLIVNDEYHFSVKLTNTGNTTRWGVPFNISCEDGDVVEELICENFGIVLTRELTEAGALTSFITDNLLGTGQRGVFSQMVIPVLPPGETVFDFTVKAYYPGQFKFEAWTGQPWSDYEQLDVDPDNLLTWTQLRIALSLQKDEEAQEVYEMLRNMMADYYLGTDDTPVVKDLFTPTPTLTESSEKQTVSYPVIRYKIRYHRGESESLDDTARDSNDKGKGHAESDRNSGAKQPSGGGDGAGQNGSCGCGGITLTIFTSFDPNDIIGYTAPSGSEYVGIDVKKLNYTVEFENDSAFANAPAHVVNVTNRLDPEVFDLKSLKMKTITIGKKVVELSGETNFVKTVDMRPEINVIGQIEMNYDAESGEARWTLSSLAPMTLEPIEDALLGLLPVNTDGNGLGEIIYEINLKDNLVHGKEIRNMATIIFDGQKAIDTPVWTNITDYRRPQATISTQTTADNGLTTDFTVAGVDEDSGIWFYDLYMRSSADMPWSIVKSRIESGLFSYTRTDEAGSNVEFRVLATDRAGNVQDNSFLFLRQGDVDSNGTVDSNDVLAIARYYIGKPVSINAPIGDINTDGVIDAQDALGASRIYLAENPNNKLKKSRKLFRR